MSAGSSTKSINVTPLIDILLVLLIIFLVLMPTMLRQETVALPQHEPDVGPPEPPITLVLHADLTVSVDGGAQVPVAAVPGVLAPQLRKPRTVFVDADDGVAWAEVVGLVDRVRGLAGNERPEAVAFQIHVPGED